MTDNISIDAINKRVLRDYTPSEISLMTKKKKRVIIDIEILEDENKSKIFENQVLIAKKIVSAFKDRKIINIMVISKTQSGKTGSMCATIKQYLEDTDNLIHIENIYVITGLSSCEWKEQTKERMPDFIKVFHRDDLKNKETFINEIKDKKDILIIMDEIQVAAKKGQTIFKTFKEAGILNKQKLYENDIKILEFTATPDGTIYDLMKWNDASTKIIGVSGDGYISSYDLLQLGRVKQYKDLYGYDKQSKKTSENVLQNIREIKDDVDNYNRRLYHIIRTRNGPEQKITIENFKKIFDSNSYDFCEYNEKSEIPDINKILIIPPKKHTFIFIKEMLRCAKTIKKKYIGILYDRFCKNPDDSTIIQGLVGRDTGYDNNGFSICYTNIDSIKNYEELWNSNFENKKIKWNSKTTKFNNGILSGINTFNNPKDYEGFLVSNDESDNNKEPIIKKFNTQEEIKDYYNKVLKLKLKGNGPVKRKPNNDGYYKATIRSISKIYSCEEIKIERKHGLNEKNYRFYPCYEDVNNKETLQWWFIHY